MNTTPADDGLNDWRRQELIWTLRWLAADPEAALRGSDQIVTADEIALDLNDWYELARTWGLVDEVTESVLRTIDDEFDAMSDQPDLWSDDAVRYSEHWAAQRARARALLEHLGISRADDEVGVGRPGGPVYIPAVRLPRLPWRRRS